MQVIKRDGSHQNFDLEKVKIRIQKFSSFPTKLKNIDTELLTSDIDFRNNIQTTEIDTKVAKKAFTLGDIERDYTILASRIDIDNHHKSTKDSFIDRINDLYRNKDMQGNSFPMISESYYRFVKKYSTEIVAHMDKKRDFLIDYYAFNTLKKSYLLHKTVCSDDNKNQITKSVVEIVQDLWMRVAINLYAEKIHQIDQSLTKIRSADDFTPVADTPPGGDTSLPGGNVSPPNVLSQQVTQEKLKSLKQSYFDKIWMTYDFLSLRLYSHASPTLFNIGTSHQQCCSCFVKSSEDSLEGICETLIDSVKTSKDGGGMGISVSDWRSKGSLIKGTGGNTKGITNFIKMLEAGANAFDQGGDKRKGAFTIFLEIWHPDLLSFISLRKIEGDHSERARDLTYGLMLNDVFMDAVINDRYWYLLDPSECPGLIDSYGITFASLYHSYVEEGKFRFKLKALDIWNEILRVQVESGALFLMHKDSINEKNNLKNYDHPITCSNLCVEIVLPNPFDKEMSVCVLGCVNLSRFVIEKEVYEAEEKLDSNEMQQAVLKRLRTPDYSTKLRPSDPVFDFRGLIEVQKLVAYNVDNVIDATTLPAEKAYVGMLMHRALGLGVVGLAEAYLRMKIPYDSKDARDLNKAIFETLAYSSISASCEKSRELTSSKLTNSGSSERKTLEDFRPRCQEIFSLIERKIKYDKLKAKVDKLCLKKTLDEIQDMYNEMMELNPGPFIPNLKRLCSSLPFYPSLLFGKGAPILEGEFQWKMWGLKESDLTGRYDWTSLAAKIKRFGVRNATLMALMPSATTSQICGTTESFFPYPHNSYMKETLAGYYTVTNPYLQEDILPYKTKELVNHLRETGGSLENCKDVPLELKRLYKTSYDIKQKVILRQCIERGPFICQSQSMNIHSNTSNISKLSELHIYSWKNGAKTGCYYVRSKPATSAQKINLIESISDTTRKDVAKKEKQSSSIPFTLGSYLPIVSEPVCLGCN